MPASPPPPSLPRHLEMELCCSSCDAFFFVRPVVYSLYKYCFVISFFSGLPVKETPTNVKRAAERAVFCSCRAGIAACVVRPKCSVKRFEELPYARVLQRKICTVRFANFIYIIIQLLMRLKHDLFSVERVGDRHFASATLFEILEEAAERLIKRLFQP